MRINSFWIIWFRSPERIIQPQLNIMEESPHTWSKLGTWRTYGNELTWWGEVNVYGTDPTIDDSMGDLDGDGIINSHDIDVAVYNRRFGFVFEIARSHDPDLSPTEGITVANSLSDLGFNSVWLVSDNNYQHHDCRSNVTLYTYEENQISTSTFVNLISLFINENNIKKNGEDLVVVYMTSHGGHNDDKYYFSLADKGYLSENKIHDTLQMFGRSLVLLWISTCYSAYAFDCWYPGDGLIIIGNIAENDAGSGKWMAAYSGGADVGFSEGASLEESFQLANNVETGHDLRIEDDYNPWDLYLI